MKHASKPDISSLIDAKIEETINFSTRNLKKMANDLDTLYELQWRDFTKSNKEPPIEDLIRSYKAKELVQHILHYITVAEYSRESLKKDIAGIVKKPNSKERRGLTN